MSKLGGRCPAAEPCPQASRGRPDPSATGYCIASETRCPRRGDPAMSSGPCCPKQTTGTLVQITTNRRVPFVHRRCILPCRKDNLHRTPESPLRSLTASRIRTVCECRQPISGAERPGSIALSHLGTTTDLAATQQIKWLRTQRDMEKSGRFSQVPTGAVVPQNFNIGGGIGDSRKAAC
jgi:hypothetical protein